jgi:hypothetical protein
MAGRPLDIPDTIFAFAVPILPARDVAASAALLESVLGFRRGAADGHPPTRLALQREGAEIELRACDDAAVLAGSGCRLRVDGIDALYARCVHRGVVAADGRLGDTARGTREFTMLAADGVRLTFFEPRRP